MAYKEVSRVDIVEVIPALAKGKQSATHSVGDRTI